MPRLLRHVPGTIEGLPQNSAHGFAARHALVHYASGAVFTFIPKNACTSLRTSLAYANGCIADVKEWAWVHNNNATFSASLADLACAPATAVILRCPFRRLASTFIDKIVSRERELWTLRRLTRDAFDPNLLTFRDFVHWIGQKGMLRADIHWRPQAEFLVYQRYDAVFTMERMDAFAGFFTQHTGCPFLDTRPYSGHVTADSLPLEGQGHADTPLSELTLQKSKGYLPRPADLFDAALIAKVRRLYAEDFRLYLALAGAEGLMFTTTDAGSKT